MLKFSLLVTTFLVAAGPAVACVQAVGGRPPWPNNWWLFNGCPQDVIIGYSDGRNDFGTGRMRQGDTHATVVNQSSQIDFRWCSYADWKSGSCSVAR